MKLQIESYKELGGYLDEDFYNDIFWNVKDMFLEVGTGEGKSACYFAWKLKDAKREMNFGVFCLDKYISDDPITNFRLKNKTPQEIVIENINDLDLPISVLEDENLPGNIADGIFIHKEYFQNKDIVERLKFWTKKTRGFISGNGVDEPEIWKALREVFDNFSVKNNNWIIENGKNKIRV